VHIGKCFENFFTAFGAFIEIKGQVLAYFIAGEFPYGVKYEPRTVIKGQVLGDFIAEFTPGAPTHSDALEGWILNFDGASNSKKAGVGLVLTTPEGSIIEQSFTLRFSATNNEAEYDVVIAGLRMAITLGITGLEIRCNSVLVICHVNGEYAAKDERMEAYMHLILSLKFKVPWCDFRRVLRSENNRADSLANLASATEFQFRREIPVCNIPTPSIQRPDRKILRLNTLSGWRDPIFAYLKDETPPEERAEAQKLQL